MRHRREALSSPNKRRKTSHTPVWRPSSSCSESEDTESRGTPPPEESGNSRNLDSTMRPLDPSDSLTVSDGSSAHSTGPSTSVDSAPSTSDKDARFWPSSLRDQEGEHPESLSSVEEERGRLLFLGHRPNKEAPQSREAGKCHPPPGG